MKEWNKSWIHHMTYKLGFTSRAYTPVNLYTRKGWNLMMKLSQWSTAVKPWAPLNRRGKTQTSIRWLWAHITRSLDGEEGDARTRGFLPTMIPSKVKGPVFGSTPLRFSTTCTATKRNLWLLRIWYMNQMHIIMRWEVSKKEIWSAKPLVTLLKFVLQTTSGVIIFNKEKKELS